MGFLRDNTNLWKHIVMLKKTRFWPKARLIKKMNGVSFECDIELDPTGLSMYLGLYEPLTVRAMRRFLSPGGVFVDVGANIGYLAAVGASLVGPTGSVYALEPVPKYYTRLRRLTEINPGFRIIASPCAAGDAARTIPIHMSRTSIGGNTFLSELPPPGDIDESLEVPVIRLDAYVRDQRVTDIALIKIDVEGFEYPVLRGLQGYFEATRARPALLVEVFPAAYPVLGYAVADLATYMSRYGYRPARLAPLGRADVDITTLRSPTNVLFVAP